MDSNKDQQIGDSVYLMDTFLKYKNFAINKKPHPNFEKYYNDHSQNKIRKLIGLDILDKQDIRVKLNYVITRKNISNEDEMLFNNMRYNLNKVNNKMLAEGNGNVNEGSLGVTIGALTSLVYSKVEHFQKLADMIVDKAINEHKFCSIYATLCFELAPYYIEINQNKKIYFRHILLNTCQTTFEIFLTNCEKIEKDKLAGLMNLLGELYNKKLLTAVIIKGCFDRLSETIEKANNSADGISALVITSYRSMLKDNNSTCKYFLDRMNAFVDNAKLHIRSKFAIQNVLDKILEM
ncbi:MAG: eukaryotic translation initiation factor 4G [Hyperionvirus sp.]|uniref:Eukaryotic translation initiation factor 4G n=1 Tax=Hyperionvirus sp. TaxID=2487770 RepID=A0A3G5A8K1_9VIRU|nr:MAG: eukaryotic translation initiation factor 4G [Hyperionvirus sp.]